MSDDPLLVEIAEGVAVLTLNRPEALNALNGALREALVAALDEADAREDLRCVVLTGTGRAFCPGYDLKEMGDPEAPAPTGDRDVAGALARLRTPVIAAVNGLAVTGGFEMALACDMILAGDSAWFQDGHARIGMLPGWGLSQRLPRVVGPYVAKEITLSARRIPAEEAARMGFVNRVVPDAELGEAARALAAEVAQWPGESVAQLKALIDEGYARPFGEAMALESDRAAEANRRD